MSEPPFRPEHFRRQDERDDPLFYTAPRLVTHIDDHAIEAIRALYAELLTPEGDVLDLMSSWKSHLPAEPPRRLTVGLGMNGVELRENDQLDQGVVHDVNRTPHLPFRDRSFDAVVMAVSVQYLTQPVQTFREVARILRPGGPFVITYSNRLFPEKAVAVWWACDAEQRARLISAYFHYAGGWEQPTSQDRSPRLAFATDPLFAVWARLAIA
ncbi:MAG: class I SAM-dependent methyltransferase [Dehalococcoidia bacterium]